jgi:4-amino-4-deoxy-L-arabinose transferase-like glycosyltransferase
MRVARAAIDAPRERSITIGLTNATLALVLLVGAAVRLWCLDSVPPELHPDEYAGWLGITDMLNGHNAPSVFLNYAVVYLPLYGVFETVSVWLLDGTIASFRLPAALLGVATALATGLFAYRLVPRRAVLLGAAGIMAILPWDVSISRIGWEPAPMLPFLLFGLYFLHRGLFARSERDLAIGFALLAVGAYSYRAESFYATTLVIALFAVEFERTRANARGLANGAAIALLILLPLIFAVVTQPHSLTSGPAQSTFAPGVNWGSLHEFGSLYVKHFAPAALFLVGDGNLQHGPATGVLYPWMAPFIVAGFLAPLRLFALRPRIFALVWLALYPLGGALTDDNGNQHFIRTLAGAPLFTIVAAIGVVACWEWFARVLASNRFRTSIVTATATLFGAIVAVEFAQFCDAYFVRYPLASAKIFHYGDRQIFDFVKANDTGYDHVCFTVLDAWNYSAMTRFYMRDQPISLSETADACKVPPSLMALGSPREAPIGSRLIGTVQNRDGTVRAYFYTFP